MARAKATIAAGPTGNMKRLVLSVSLALATPLTACGATPTDASESVPNSDPYIQTLRAMMNAGGCQSQGPKWRPTPEERAEVLRTILELETDLLAIEGFARAKGFGDYIRAGRESFQRMAAEELNVTCYPDQNEAFNGARQSIDSFRKHVNALASTRR